MSKIIRSSLTTFFLESLEHCINSQKSITMEEKLALVEKFQKTGRIPTEVAECVEKTNIKPFFETEGHGYLKVPLEEIAQLDLVEKITPYSYMDTKDPNDEFGMPIYLEEDQDAKTYIDRLKQRGIPVDTTEHGIIPDKDIQGLHPYTKDIAYYFAHYERDFNDLLDIRKASKSEDEKRAILSIIEDRFGAKKSKIKNSD